jgi:hypothetical protein
MSDRISEQTNQVQTHGSDNRRHQLRTLLVTAAGEARQTRQTPIFTAVPVAPPARRTLRQRLTMLFSAAG